MSFLRAACVVLYACAGPVVSAGCSSNPASSASAADGAWNDSRMTEEVAREGQRTLLTDPSRPRCDLPGARHYQIVGRLDGESLSIMDSVATYIRHKEFEMLRVVEGMVRSDLLLTWTAPLEQDRAVPLTGQRFLVPNGQPLAGTTYCVTSGQFGSSSAPPPRDGQGRTLEFTITGARRGGCTGPEVEASLKGCDFRANNYFPVAVDAGSDARGPDR